MSTFSRDGFPLACTFHSRSISLSIAYSVLDGSSVVVAIRVLRQFSLVPVLMSLNDQVSLGNGGLSL